MPKLKNTVPKYRRHKASGQAVVTIAGTDQYLGKFGSKPSKQFYDRLIAEWLASGRQTPPPEPHALTVTELVARFWRFAKQHYRRPDGTPTETTEVMKPALRMLKDLYGDLPVDDFGPVALKRLQQFGVEQAHSRCYINDNIDRVRRVFRWGVSEELVDESTYRRLQTVDGLRKGKTDAKEPPPVPPVEDSVVDATLPHLPAIVADMVRVQRLTGARPGEVCRMRPCDIDQTGEVWVYIPGQHKTEHHGKNREIMIGPKAQVILTNYLVRDPSDFCFKPTESVADHFKKRRARRVTPISHGNRPMTRRRRCRRPAGDHYTNDSYRHGIHRACDRAFPAPTPLGQQEGESNAARIRRLTDGQRKQLAHWQSEHRWNPNQLRHTMGTKTRELFGIEAVAAALGHSKTDTSEIYAERNLRLAAEVAKQVG